MKVRRYFSRVGYRNVSTPHFIISLRVQKYSDIFDELDNSPLKLRSINKNIQLYLKESLSTISNKYGIGISFHVTGESKDELKEESIIAALEKFCLVRLKSKKAALKSYNIDAFIYVLISFLLLITGFDLETKLNRTILVNTILEGVNIGEWIFLWEAITMLFFRAKDINNEIEEIHRILKSNISFTYEFMNEKH